MRADGRVVTLAIALPPLPKERQEKNHKGQDRLPSGGAVACKATERGLLKALTSN